MAFSSGEFWPRIDLNPLGRAAAIYNNQLWFIGATDAQTGFVRSTTFSLAGNIENDYTQGWTTTDSGMTAVKYRGQSQQGPSTFAKCAAAAAPSGLYLFWNELPYEPMSAPGWADLVAARFSPDEHLQYGWGGSIQLLWPQSTQGITTDTLLQGGSSDPGYLSYAVTPGDITTYTPEAWNARLAALGYAWHNPDPRWSNDPVNYFRDVIVPNAYVFTINQKGGPAVPQEYIECEWGQASTGEISFGQASTNFVENSWQLTNKDYVGVSGGFDVKDPVFGILGEAAQYQFLVGTTESWNTTDTSTSGTQWGVALTGPTGNPAEWGPPTRSLDEAPAAMEYYTFRIYLLPPPTPASNLPANQWAQELIQYLPAGHPTNVAGPDEIDSGSQPWRIIFVVTEYRTNDGTKSYSYGRQWDLGSG